MCGATQHLLWLSVRSVDVTGWVVFFFFGGGHVI